MVVAVTDAGERIDVTEAINFSSTADYAVGKIGDECWRIYSDYHLLETYNLFWEEYFHFPTEANKVKYPVPTIKFGATEEDHFIVEDDDFDEDGDFDNDNENQNNEGEETSATELVSNLNIFAFNRTIVVENATDEIFVYDAIGRLVCRDATPCVRVEIPMEKSGVYVVKVGTVSKKVMIE